jgi:3-deoxy-manno-octulosonate cytidylyltransferase (CMP-KDO synthetase)
MTKFLIIIPARLAATRLPRKVLKDIHGLPMVIQVANRAKEAEVGDVIIATEDQEVIDVANKYGFEAVLTDGGILSGTDRVYDAYKRLNRKYDYVINLQGDMPFVAPETIKQVAELLTKNEADISTAAAVTTDVCEVQSNAVVKVALSYKMRAIYFSRTIPFPYGEGEFYKHVGIYGFTPDSLQRFVKLPQSPLEKRESLEQLRALEEGMTINVAVVNDFPISVDIPEDLAKFAIK